MRETVEITVDSIVPDPGAVLERQGLSPVAIPSKRVASLAQASLELLAQQAAPVGLLAEVTGDEFAAIYRGESRNEPETPLAEIFPRADRLALFAVTLGDAVSGKITELFGLRDFALATMLDAAASEATEKAGEAVEERFLERLREMGTATPSTKLLRYSPGYCGWHISGQRALFAALKPEAVGISLRESFLMEPLKSISGVIVAGPARIHDFEDAYPFCAECATRSCRERIQRLSRDRSCDQ
jgi:hypothetical protein